MFGTCTTDGCERPSTMLDNRCSYHGVVEKARWLPAEDFDRLRDALATLPPVTEDERNASRARHALRDIEWRARDLKRSKRTARKVGATDSQIADAIKRGKDEVA